MSDCFRSNPSVRSWPRSKPLARWRDRHAIVAIQNSVWRVENSSLPASTRETEAHHRHSCRRRPFETVRDRMGSRTISFAQTAEALRRSSTGRPRRWVTWAFRLLRRAVLNTRAFGHWNGEVICLVWSLQTARINET